MSSPSKQAFSRRKFFRASVGEMAGMVDAFRKGTQYTLDEVFTLSDRQLGAVKPLIYDEVVIQEEGGKIVGYTLEDDQGTTLLEVSPIHLAIIDAFNGSKTLLAIARSVAATYQITQDEAFKRVKNIFQLLVRNSICVPSRQ